MGAWSFTKQTALGGQWRLRVTKLTRGGRNVNASVIRGAPTQFDSFSSADPFGDSTAVFTFPKITPFDDFDSGDLAPWLGYYSNVDLWWVHGVVDDGHYGSDLDPTIRRINPFTQLPDLVAPDDLYAASGPKPWNRDKAWEGYIAGMDWVELNGATCLQIQCQGALFQLDRYLQKPFFPAQPWPLEALIAAAFSRTSRPQLRTRPLKVAFPAGWSKKVPKYTGGSANVYAPAAKPGTLWTGLTTRQTGSWEHALTGFVQDRLTDMIVDNASGVTPGNQWTVLLERATQTHPLGRQPVLQVRDRFRAPDFAMWVGTPGLAVRLSGDSTQSENIVYGEGTDLNGEVWRNAVISNDGSRTDYLPLAYDREVWPPDSPSTTANRGAFVSEAYTKFGTGFSQSMATTVSEQNLARNLEPGWSGTITLSTDPALNLPRWLIRAGMTMLLKGFQGTGERGMPFHISSVEAAPMAGTVTLTVDTRYRDLLTVAESLQRTRDPLTPVRMLQVNKTSVMIQDVQAPWDYSAGSGYIPRRSTEFYRHKPTSTFFPYTSWARSHPPLHYPHWYVKVNAGSRTRAKRWTLVPVLTSEKGTINRSEFFCVDELGRIVKAPFHVSFYKTYVTPSDMPRDAHGPSPFIDGAFETVNPATGQVWDAGNFLAPNDQFLTGWGNVANGISNRAGYSPGSEAEGGNPTGVLFDDATWDFDNTNNPDFMKYLSLRKKQPNSAITIYAMFYCEHPSTVYFGGRLFRQNPGVS